jgi:hypothetical protein
VRNLNARLLPPRAHRVEIRQDGAKRDEQGYPAGQPRQDMVTIREQRAEHPLLEVPATAVEGRLEAGRRPATLHQAVEGDRDSTDGHGQQDRKPESSAGESAGDPAEHSNDQQERCPADIAISSHCDLDYM